MASKHVTIRLKSIDYTGDNLGDDIRIDLTVEGRTITYNKKIKNSTKVSLKQEIIEKAITTDIALPMTIKVVEKDPLFNDTGSNSGSFQILCDGAEFQAYTLAVTVPGDSLGDRNKKAVFRAC